MKTRTWFRTGVLLLVGVTLFAANCSGSRKSQYAENQEKDAGQNLTYKQWVAAIGQDKTDAIYAAGTDGELNLLSYGAGSSNVIALLNGITDINKIIALLGNPATNTGLGAVKIVGLLNRIDYHAQQTRYDGAILAPAPDTIVRMQTMVNHFSLADVSAKLIALVNALAPSRDLTGAGATALINNAGGYNAAATSLVFDTLSAANAFAVGDYLLIGSESVKVTAIAYGTSTTGTLTVTRGTTPAAMADNATITQQSEVIKLDRMAILVGQYEDGNNLDKLLILLDLLSAAEITGKLVTVINGVTNIAKLVETIDDIVTTNPGGVKRMQEIISGVTDANSLVGVINALPSPGANKLSYIVESVTSTTALIYIMNNIDQGAKLGELVNAMEDGSSWASQRYGTCSNAAFNNNRTGCLGAAATWNGEVWQVNADPGAPAFAGSGMPRMVTLLENLSTSFYPATLVCVLNQVDTGATRMTKMARIVQDIEVITDLVFLMKEFQDPGVSATPCQNMGFIVENMQLTSSPRMVTLLDGQRLTGNADASAGGLAAPTNCVGPGFGGGACALPNANNSGEPQGYYLEKLAVVVTNLINSPNEGPLKVTQIVDGVTDMDKMVDLVYDVSVLANLSAIINGIYPASNASPQDNAVNTLVRTLEGITAGQAWRLVGIIDNISNVNNMIDLINLVSSSTQHDNATCVAPAAPATCQNDAGDKLVGIINAVDDTTTTANVLMNMVFILNNVDSMSQMAALLNDVSLANIGKVATLINDVDDPVVGSRVDTDNTWSNTAGSRGTSVDMGRMVNLIKYVSNLAQVAYMINNINEGNKLAAMVNGVTNSSDLVALVNEAITIGTIDDMVLMVNALDGPSNTLGLGDQMPKIVNLLNQMRTNGSAALEGDCTNNAFDGTTSGACTGGGGTWTNDSTLAHADQTLVAQLLQPDGGSNAAGVGYANMVHMLYTLSNATKAQEVANLLTGLNSSLYYNQDTATNCAAGAANTITKREAMVRLLYPSNPTAVVGGFNYCLTGTKYPGMGPSHIAAIANGATGTSIADMVTMMNDPGIDLGEVNVLVGCIDKAGDMNGNGTFTSGGAYGSSDSPWNPTNAPQSAAADWTSGTGIPQPNYMAACQTDEPAPGFFWAL